MKGILIKSTGSWYSVLTEEKKIVACRIKGNFRLDSGKFSNPLAVGDSVEIAVEEGQESAMITTLYDRKNYICRTDPHKKAYKQIIATNIDQAIVFASLKQPRVPLGFIDRFSVIAEMYHIPLHIIFNKADLYADEEMENFFEAKSIYETLGYTVHLISVLHNSGVEKLHSILKDKTTLVSGQSGVGKSAFINTICPQLDLKTQSVSDYNEKGQHTTTFAEMHPITFGGFIIDTPGVKELGIADITKEELSHYFVEMRRLLPQCKFNNCTHIDEPNCAVKAAFDKGEIHPLRFSSYFSILNEIEIGLKFWQKK